MKALSLKAEQFVTDARGTRIGVVLNLKTYQRLREAEEELDDVRAYDGGALEGAARGCGRAVR